MKDIDLISEHIERAALESLHQKCPLATRQALGLDLVTIADGVISCARNDDSILLNRALGFGIDHMLSADTITAIANTYTDKNIRNYFLHAYSNSISTDASKLLSSSAFTKKRSWMKFCSNTLTAKESKTSLRIEKIGVAKSTEFGAIVCRAFGMSKPAIPLLAGLANDPRWHLYISYAGDFPAGAGAIFIHGNIGWLDWGATNPEFRCRGSQGSIMAERLNLAKSFGCQYVFAETGVEVDGDPQHSYKNILKAGFRESVLRLNYAPSPHHAITQ